MQDRGKQRLREVGEEAERICDAAEFVLERLDWRNPPPGLLDHADELRRAIADLRAASVSLLRIADATGLLQLADVAANELTDPVKLQIRLLTIAQDRLYKRARK